MARNKVQKCSLPLALILTSATSHGIHDADLSKDYSLMDIARTLEPLNKGGLQREQIGIHSKGMFRKNSYT